MKRHVNNVVPKMLQDERKELRKKVKEIDDMDVEEHSPLISGMPNLE